jgi:hypothetical protein
MNSFLQLQSAVADGYSLVPEIGRGGMAIISHRTSPHPFFLIPPRGKLRTSHASRETPFNAWGHP